MADKTANVRVTADPKGFISGMKSAETAAKQSGAKIESALVGAVNSAGQKMRSATGRFLKQGAEEGARGTIAALKDVEVKSKSIFARIASNAKAAFGAAAKSMGDFKRGLTGGGKESASETIGGYAKYAAAAVLAVSAKGVSDANRIQDKATRVSIGARGAGQEGADPKQLMAEWFAITQDIKGVTADQLADGAAKFVAMTGDLKTARSSMRDFAIAAQASGASVEDVAGTAAAISQQFKITDPEQIKDVLASLIFQGKAGAFELKDAAALFPRLAAAGAAFGLDKGAGGVKTLGGFTQLVRGGTGSGEEAATAAIAVLSAFKAEAGTLKTAGVNVYDKQGKTRDLPTLLAESIAKLGGNDVQKKNEMLGTVFGREGAKAINPLSGDYMEFFRQSKGKNDQERQADAMEQLRQKILASVNAAGTWEDVQKDQATASSVSSAKVTAAWEKFVGMTSEKLLPTLGIWADKLTRAGGALDLMLSGIGMLFDGISWVADQFGWAAGTPESTQLKSQADMERHRVDPLRDELKKNQSEQAKTKDPGKLDELKRRENYLQTRVSVADTTADVLDKAARGAAGGQTPFEKKMAELDKQKAAREAAGMQDVPVKDGKPGAPVKATLDTGGKTLDVRVTNAKDIGGGPSGKPTPGYHTPVP